MNGLAERYVAAALEHVPEHQRQDVGTEIRGAIDDMVAPRIDAGATDEDATRAALTELGDPARLAAAYDDRKRYLIGPGWYPAYLNVLKRVLGVALPVIAVVAMVTALAEDDGDLADALASGLGSVYELGLQILLWVTVGFVIAERAMGPTGPERRARAWSVDDLPAIARERQIGLADTLISVIAMTVFGILAFVAHDRGIGNLVSGLPDTWSAMPLVNPELGLGWVIGFYALLSISIVAAVDRYFTAYWTRPALLQTVAESGLWIAWIVALAFSEPIFNPALVQQFDGYDADFWAAGGGANLIVALVISAISLWEMWEAWKGHRMYERDRLQARTAT